MAKSLLIFRCDSPLTMTALLYTSLFQHYFYLVDQIQFCHCGD